VEYDDGTTVSAMLPPIASYLDFLSKDQVRSIFIFRLGAVPPASMTKKVMTHCIEGPTSAQHSFDPADAASDYLLPTRGFALHEGDLPKLESYDPEAIQWLNTHFGFPEGFDYEKIMVNQIYDQPVKV